MTAQRQEASGKRPGAPIRPGIAVIVLLAAVGLVAPSGSALAATTERIVVNRFSGLAIEGFDPVAYFVDQAPMLGRPDFEAAEGGAVWRFLNEGNRTSFLAHPEVYGPQFGGYDPVDIGRGVTVAGNPRFWLVTGQRLYLFGLESHRDAFAAEPGRFLAEAEERWPALLENLAQ
jgi:hypothetical protein